VLARRLLQDGHQVHLLVRPAHQSWRLERIRAHVQLHTVELADPAGVADVVRGIRPEWVFHLAAHGAYSSQRDARAILQTNLLGTLNLLEACQATGFEAFVHSGTSSEYGWKDHAPAEEEPLEPGSHYAIGKAAATWLCRHQARQSGARICTLRLYSVYGPWETPTRLIPTLVVRGLEGKLPPLVSPTTARDYVFVDDVVEAFLAAAERAEPGAVFNVGSGVQTSLLEVVEVTRRVLGLQVEPDWGAFPSRSWDTDVWVSDPRAIERALGWQARHSFEDGFRATVDWLRRDPEMLAVYRTLRGEPP
jgi:UDP-glucose 4-epimerase